VTSLQVFPLRTSSSRLVLGGIVAQVVLATMQTKLSHAVLLATTPAGRW